MTDDGRDPPIEGGVFEIDKAAGVDLLNQSCIRLIFAQSEPLAVHLAAMAASDVIRAVAKRRSIEQPLDMDKYVKPEYRKQFWAAMKGSYNFLKHADEDPDGVDNIAGICRRNDLQVLLNIGGAQKVFGSWSHHYGLFALFMRVEYPMLIETPDDDATTAAVRPMLDELRAVTREERLELLSVLLARFEPPRSERADDHRILKYDTRARDRG